MPAATQQSDSERKAKVPRYLQPTQASQAHKREAVRPSHDEPKRLTGSRPSTGVRAAQQPGLLAVVGAASRPVVQAGARMRPAQRVPVPARSVGSVPLGVTLQRGSRPAEPLQAVPTARSPAAAVPGSARAGRAPTARAADAAPPALAGTLLVAADAGGQQQPGSAVKLSRQALADSLARQQQAVSCAPSVATPPPMAASCRSHEPAGAAARAGAGSCTQPAPAVLVLPTQSLATPPPSLPTGGMQDAPASAAALAPSAAGRRVTFAAGSGGSPTPARVRAAAPASPEAAAPAADPAEPAAAQWVVLSPSVSFDLDPQLLPPSPRAAASPAFRLPTSREQTPADAAASEQLPDAAGARRASCWHIPDADTPPRLKAAAPAAAAAPAGSPWGQVEDTWEDISLAGDLTPAPTGGWAGQQQAEEGNSLAGDLTPAPPGGWAGQGEEEGDSLAGDLMGPVLTPASASAGGPAGQQEEEDSSLAGDAAPNLTPLTSAGGWVGQEEEGEEEGCVAEGIGSPQQATPVGAAALAAAPSPPLLPSSGARGAGGSGLSEEDAEWQQPVQLELMHQDELAASPALQVQPRTTPPSLAAAPGRSTPGSAQAGAGKPRAGSMTPATAGAGEPRAGSTTPATAGSGEPAGAAAAEGAGSATPVPAAAATPPPAAAATPGDVAGDEELFYTPQQAGRGAGLATPATGEGGC